MSDERDDLLDDMHATLRVLRLWLMELGEQHEGLDASVIDGLLRRYREIREDES